MPAMRSSHSTLGREFQLARAFLSIMQFRMGSRLAFTVDAPATLLDCECPPTIVGTLLENAIKHGLEPARAGGRIDVSAWHDGTALVIEVADTGIGFSNSSGSGVGLANARERLAMLYGPRAELDLTLNPAGGVVARVSIPTPLPPDAAIGSGPGTPMVHTAAAEMSSPSGEKVRAESAPAPAGADPIDPPSAEPEPFDAQRPAA
jgi:hypothetical protein